MWRKEVKCLLDYGDIVGVGGEERGHDREKQRVIADAAARLGFTATIVWPSADEVGEPFTAISTQ